MIWRERSRLISGCVVFLRDNSDEGQGGGGAEKGSWRNVRELTAHYKRHNRRARHPGSGQGERHNPAASLLKRHDIQCCRERATCDHTFTQLTVTVIQVNTNFETAVGKSKNRRQRVSFCCCRLCRQLSVYYFV